MKTVSSVVFDLRLPETVQESSFKTYDTFAWALYEIAKEIRYLEFVAIYLKKDKAVKLLVEMAKYFNDITIDSDAFDVEDVIITVSYDGTVIVEVAEVNNNYKESCAIITLIDEDCKTSLLKFHQDNLENISIFSMDEDQEYE